MASALSVAAQSHNDTQSSFTSSRCAQALLARKLVNVVVSINHMNIVEQRCNEQ